MARHATHPGEHLSEELDALSMSAAELARRGAGRNAKNKRVFPSFAQ
jgi:plasmid maintenance system antidote protein VapI